MAPARASLLSALLINRTRRLVPSTKRWSVRPKLPPFKLRLAACRWGSAPVEARVRPTSAMVPASICRSRTATMLLMVRLPWEVIRPSRPAVMSEPSAIARPPLPRSTWRSRLAWKRPSTWRASTRPAVVLSARSCPALRLRRTRSERRVPSVATRPSTATRRSRPVLSCWITPAAKVITPVARVVGNWCCTCRPRSPVAATIVTVPRAARPALPSARPALRLEPLFRVRSPLPASSRLPRRIAPVVVMATPVAVRLLVRVRPPDCTVRSARPLMLLAPRLRVAPVTCSRARPLATAS